MLVSMPRGYLSLVAKVFLEVMGCVHLTVSHNHFQLESVPFKAVVVRGEGRKLEGGERGRGGREGKRGEELGGCLSRQGQSVILSDSCFSLFPVGLTAVIEMF